jgi:Zn-dependent membrane protease YugP
MKWVLLLFLASLLVSWWARRRVARAWKRYSTVPASSGHTGADVARLILERAGLSGVSIVQGGAVLGDHYDPVRSRIVLTPSVYLGTSLASHGVAAHECGHALQHRDGYEPLRWRMAAVRAATVAGQLVAWVPLLGVLTGLLAFRTALVLISGGWAVLLFFNLVTLDVEFDASRRARAELRECGLVSSLGDEEGKIDEVLQAAALTYVAAFLNTASRLAQCVLPSRG